MDGQADPMGQANQGAVIVPVRETLIDCLRGRSAALSGARFLTYPLVRPTMPPSNLSDAAIAKSEHIIQQFHSYLNRPGIVPEKAYRRDRTDYRLVSYINNMTGLFLSRHFEVIPFFIARAVEHMQDFPPNAAQEGYYALITQYVCQLAYHLQNCIEGIELPEARIPPEILKAGPQTPP